MKLPRLAFASWLWLGAGTLVAGALLWLLWPRAVMVEAQAIDRGEVTREVGEEGRIRIRDMFTVTAPIAGQLDRIEFQPGDQISKGSVIARIRPVVPALLDARAEREAAALVAAARSALSLARADAGLAAAERERVAQLFERGFAARAALDRAQTGLEVANALVQQRKADLARAEAMLARPSSQAKAVTVRSPSSGRVIQILQESETVLLPGAPLLEVGDPEGLEVVAEYLSQDAALVREGACAFVESAGIPPIPARVKTVEPYARTKVSALGVEEQRVRIILSFDEVQAARSRLGHGYRVDVRIVMFRQQDVLRVPTDALVRGSEGEWAVFRIVSDRARLTPIEAGDGDGRFRTVAKGLAPGDRVVLFPGETLKDGDLVRQAK